MGARQSAPGASPRQNIPNSNRHSLDGSLDQSSGSRRIGGLFGAGSGLSATPPERSGLVTRRRRRRDRNDLLIEAHSLPASLFPSFLTADIKCPVCNKRVASDEIELHLVTCLSKPRVSYNEDTLTADANECIICFEDMLQGERIARLPCLCIYHKKCLDEWFQRNRCCPEHPDQIPQEFNSEQSSNVTINNHQQENTTTQQLPDNQTIAASSAPNSLQIPVDNESHASEVRESHPSEPPTNVVESNDLDENHIEHEDMFQLDAEHEQNINEPNNDDSAVMNLSNISNLSCDSSMNEPFHSAATSMCENQDETSSSSTTNKSSINSPSFPTNKTIVHVDDGSIHGTSSLSLDDDEIAQLASKIKTILVAESPRENSQVDNT